MSSITVDGVEKAQLSTVITRDSNNVLFINQNIFNSLNSQDPIPSTAGWASLSRLRKGFRQNLGLERKNAKASWVLLQDIYSSADEDKKSNVQLWQDGWISSSPLGAAIRCSNLQVTTICNLLDVPTIRFNAMTERHENNERLLCLAFTVDPPTDPKEAKSPYLAGEITFRPDCYWVVRSASFRLAGKLPLGTLIGVETTLDYYTERDRRMLPKQVNYVATVISKENKRLRMASTATYEYDHHDTLPESAFSLSQFGLSERDPPPNAGQSLASEGPLPPPGWEKRNYLVAQPAVPLYLWVTGAGLVCVLGGVGLRIMAGRRKHATSTPGDVSKPGEGDHVGPRS